MENKYYLNKDGLIELIKSTSKKIRENTTNEIQFQTTTQIDPETNEEVQVQQLVNPTKITTSNAVVQYLKTHNKVTINQETSQQGSSGSAYSVYSNSRTYAGDEDKTLEIKLITTGDIDSLFPD